jgi:branched-subunit amino acid transport protein
MQNVRVRNPFSPYFRIPSFFSSSSPKQPLEDDVSEPPRARPADLGYNALPFLIRSELLLFPVAIFAAFYIVSLLGFNISHVVIKNLQHALASFLPQPCRTSACATPSLHTSVSPPFFPVAIFAAFYIVSLLGFNISHVVLEGLFGR